MDSFRDRLVAMAPERVLALLCDFIECKVEHEKLKRFATASEVDRGFVKGMEAIANELHGISAEIEKRRKEGPHG